MSLLNEWREIKEALIRHWPGGLGYRLRQSYYRRRMKYLGKNVVIEPGVRFMGLSRISIGDGTHIYYDCLICAGPVGATKAEVRRLPNERFRGEEGEVRIGRNVHMAAGCYILGSGGVQIGDCCGLAGGARILSATYHYRSFEDPSRQDIYFAIEGGAEHACYLVGPVVLGDNSGVASNAVILPGTAIEDKSFVAIGALVHSGVYPPNSVLSGSPAIRIRDRFPSSKPAPVADGAD
jgi:acetyltransferase-like isoleucine patch superfamily enzyme